MGTLHEGQHTFLIISRSDRLRIINVSEKRCREYQNTHFVFNNLFFFFENRAVCGIISKNIAEPNKPQMTI